MLSIDVRSLESGAVQVTGSLASEDAVFLDGDARPEGAIEVTGRLSAAGAGRYYFSGKFAGKVRGECGRCLQAAEAEVGATVALLFAEAGDENEDEPDVFPVTGGDTVVDLRPALREQWLLEQPAILVCRPECKGLCARCGADLNAGACSCAPETDPRWDALRALRSDA
ncbi:MAG: DUF177 domain-containing protein [Gemmatimonadaceae bacterium]|nr:DUF177 domain-containing protein [Gemmatimonadaceae bacterium]